MVIKLVMFVSESEPNDKGINLTNEKDKMIKLINIKMILMK